MFVVDANVTMAWCFEDEATEATEAVLDRLRSERALVPAIWPVEVANVLLIVHHRGRVNEAQIGRFVRLLAQLPIDVDETSADVASLVALGRTHELSSYDASYLLLAERAGLPLATLDDRLAKAAARAGVPLVIPPLT